VDISHADMSTLRAKQWLTDNVIVASEFMMSKINPKIYYADPWVSEALQKLGGINKISPKLREEMKRYKQMLVPVNVAETHWALVLVNLTDKTMTFYDSMNTAPEPFFEMLMPLLNILDMSGSGQYTTSKAKLAKQENSFDCGVYMIMFAWCLTAGIKPPENIDQTVVNNFRTLISLDILDLKPPVP